MKNPNAVNTGNGLERGSGGATTFAKSEVFKGFLSTAANCHRNAPESNTRQKKKKNEEKIFRPKRDFINYSVQSELYRGGS